jgi:hypothetical protein
MCGSWYDLGVKPDPPAELAAVPALHDEIGGCSEQASLSSDMSRAPTAMGMLELEAGKVPDGPSLD